MAKEKNEPNISEQTAGVISGLTREDLLALIRESRGDSGNSAIALLADTMERLVAAQNRNADATEKTVTRSNATHPGVSAFNPKGEREFPRPKLKAQTLFLGVPQWEDTLTEVEIDLFNSITSGRTARDGKWVANYTPSTNGGKATLHVTIAIQEGDLASTPPLVQILAELATGAKSEDMSTLMVEMATMKAELDALKAQQPQAVGA